MDIYVLLFQQWVIPFLKTRLFSSIIFIQITKDIGEVNAMKLRIAILSILCFMSTTTVQAFDKQNKTVNEDVQEEFNIDLTGYEYESLATLNQIGKKVTPMMQLYLWVLQLEEEWIDEPRFYIKGDKGYIHLWKKDGTNVLYKVKKRTSGTWDIIDIHRKKIDRIPVPKTLLKDLLIERLVDPISKAVKENFKPRLWYRGEEKVLEIKKDETNNVYYVTVQVVTFEGAHNPPYGEETITFQIKGIEIEAINYKHRDIPEKEWTKLKLR